LGLLCAALIPVVQAAPQGPPAAAVEPLPATIEFNRDIRPILADKCFQCHGPGTQMATIRFDLEDGAKHALSGGRFAIVTGDPARSQMIARIMAANPAIRMPRSQGGAAAGEPLTARNRAADRGSSRGRSGKALVVHPADATGGARGVERCEGVQN
jgi:hypothetical protein